MEQTFGDKLKQARINRGLKQSELAKQLGVTNTTISNWEKNVSKPDLDMLSYICGILSVKAGYFLSPTLPDDEISIPEFEIIKKYRSLDDPGRAYLSKIRSNDNPHEERSIYMALANTNSYTIDEIYALPEGQRAELVDGQIYYMAPPNRIHQKLVNRLSQTITNYIDKRKGDCELYPSPFAVFLNADDKNYVEPDISIICDKNKLDDYGCHGAPDWIIEVTSPSDPQRDYGIKLFKYRTAGVREYWIVNPQKKTVMVYDFEKDLLSNQYIFDDDIPVCIYDDLVININKLI